VPVFLAPDGSLLLATGRWQSMSRPLVVTEQVVPGFPPVRGLALDPPTGALGAGDGLALGWGDAVALGDALALGLGVVPA
jgi:hypothetical protein